MQIISHRTGHRHGAGLRRMVVVPMTPPVADLNPAVALEFFDDLTNFHQPQGSPDLENHAMVKAVAPLPESAPRRPVSHRRH